MATFITLANFTDQGIKNIKDSPERFNAFRAIAEKAGLTIKSVHYTLGQHDMVLITEGPEEAYMAVGLKLGSLGNVRSQTLRGFSVDEFKKFVSKMA
ncbi:MAG: GYD domain-containing protein [Myxococcaceae bacterium]